MPDPAPIYGEQDVHHALLAHDRCSTDAEHAAWSRRYGRALCMGRLNAIGANAGIPHAEIYLADGSRSPFA